MLNEKVRRVIVIIMLVAIVAALILSGILPFLMA